MEKKTITIGNRKIHDITEQELIEYLCFSGCIASLEFWSKPIIHDFHSARHDCLDDSVFFEVEQTQLKETAPITSRYRYHITLKSKNGDLKSGYVLYTEKWGSYPMQLKNLNWFAKRGFEVEFEGIEK